MSSHNGTSPNGVLGNTVLTTGQVAAIVGVAPRTVTKWCDREGLRHYRIPGSLDRRVKRDDLEAFLRDHRMDFVLPLTGVLLVGHATLPSGWQTGQCATDTFQAGLLLANWVPAVVVLDAMRLGRQTAMGVASAIRGDFRLRRVRVLAVVAGDDREEAFVEAGCEAAVRGVEGLRMLGVAVGGTT